MTGASHRSVLGMITATQQLADPATGKEIGSVPELGVPEITEAIKRAHEAFGPWNKRTAKERSDLLLKLLQLMNEHHDECVGPLSLSGEL